MIELIIGIVAAGVGGLLGARYARRSAATPPPVGASLRDMHQDLHFSEARERPESGTAGAATWTWELATGHIEVTPAFLELTGYDKRQLGHRRRDLFSLVHPDDRARVWNILTDYLERRTTACETEFRLRFQDGRYVWLFSRAVAEWDRKGTAIRLEGVFDDITARLDADDERDRLFNLSVDMLAVVGYDQQLQQANPAWVRVLGWSRDDLMSAPLTSFIHPEDRAVATDAFASMRSGTDEEKFSCRMSCRDGSYRWLSFNAAPYADRQVIFTVARDITEQKEAERLRLETQERLRSLGNQLALVEDRHRRDLAVAIHDGLAQQLFGLRAQITLLKYPEKLDNYQEVVANTIDILDETMTQARTLSFELFPPVLYELGLEGALQWLTHTFGERVGITCIFETVGEVVELPEDVRAMAYQCVRELLANIRKHADATKALVTLESGGGEVRITVADDGRGFNPEGGDEAAGSHGAATGFGLFSIRERLRSVGGRMWFETSPGEGALVGLAFPLSKAEAETET